MNTIAAVGLWAYLVAVTLVEVALEQVNPGGMNVDIVIGLIAAVSAILTALFSMGLKYEITAIKYLFLIPVLLVAVLIITLVLSFPIIQ